MELVALAIGILLICSAILPWVNRSKVSSLQDNIVHLRRRVFELEKKNKEGSSRTATFTTPEEIQTMGSMEEKKEILKQVKEEIKTPSDPVIKNISTAEKKGMEENFVKPKKSSFNNMEEMEESKASSFEMNFGAKLPVWIGGIALAFAGFYLVKYSIDTGLLNPMNRVILGVIFGILLLFASLKIMTKRHIANAYKISQSVAGAGVIVLYISIYAATEMYNFLNPFIGFSAMAGITFGTIFLSLRNGLPIAFMGLIGGFLTPILISSHNPSSAALFSYLFILFYGLTAISKKKNWWIITSVATAAIIFMTLAWIFGAYFISSDAIVLGIFLIAVTGTLVIQSSKVIDDEPKTIGNCNLMQITNYIALGISAIIMGVIIALSKFSIISWGMYGIMTVGGLFLTKHHEKQYGFIPWILLTVNLVTLVVGHMSYGNLAIIIGVAASLFIGLGYYFMLRSKTPVNWAALISVSAPLFYILAYTKLKHAEINIPLFWGYLGLAFAGAGIYTLKAILKKTTEGRPKDYISGIFATSITALITSALAIEMHRNFLPIAIAGEIFAISLINLRVKIKALRFINLVLAAAFATLLIPQIILLVQLSLYSLLEVKANLQNSLPLVRQPLLQLGLPAVFFAASCALLSKIKYDRVVYIFEIISATLIGTMGYYLTRNLLHPDVEVIFIKAGFFERGLMTNIFFVFGLGCLFMGRKYSRAALSLCGIVLSCMAVFRLGYFDLLIHNPLNKGSQVVGATTIFNSLLLTYGLPIAWCLIAAKEFEKLYLNTLENIVKLFSLILFMALVTLQVTQFFHGEILAYGRASNAEIYSYSVAWILSGIFLLSLGFLKENKMLRTSSLVIIIISVAKVFLYDASELEGILRVLSFFGLGISLLGLSYFYTKFVFKES